MILHEYRIPYEYGDVIRLKPLFDAHVGSKSCDEKALKKYLADCDEKTYLIGGGDLMDSIITRDVKRYTKADDLSLTDAIIDEQIDRVEAMLLPYKDRIIGLGTGNHEQTINKYHGTHPIRRLCKRLGTTSIGYSWLVRLRFSCNGGRGRTLTIRGHHGWGGGSRTRGADLTKFASDILHWDADMGLYGHTHKKQSDTIERMTMVGNKLVAKPIRICICGTFKKTLSETDDPTYSEEKGYPPTSIGGVDVTIDTKPKDWLRVTDNA